MARQLTAVQLVWFKRDLRVRDHGPLYQAALQGPVLPLYVVEPSLLQADDSAAVHWRFIEQSLHDLRDHLAHLGQPLVVRVGEVIPVLEQLRRYVAIARIWAHEETGNALTFARDRAVRRWAREQGIALTELPQGGVVRGLRGRAGWEETWETRYAVPLVALPQLLKPVTLVPGAIPTADHLRLRRSPAAAAQVGGETAGRAVLESFLAERGGGYAGGISSPLTAADAGSRLSPYLAHGTVSAREVVQRLRQRHAEIRRLRQEERAQLDGSWLRSLRMFESRLHWRDHFMQKLETEPRLEFASLIPAFDDLRSPDAARLAAWQKGRTGYPLVDASMRALRKTGWLNFRMRALLVSFAAHDLWLPWREPALHLARLFVDYEPGIHYCQVQMQYGNTGNRALRIYNPVKQSLEHDPQGVFIRRWVPELRGVPDSFIHAPWLMDLWSRQQSDCVVGQDYPFPIVNHEQVARLAREKLDVVRKQPQTADQIAAARALHNTPDAPTNGDAPTRRRKPRRPNPDQLRLPL